MPIWALYLVTVAIWGSSWYGITEQLGVVEPSVSLAYRFLLAAAMLWVFCAVTGRRLKFTGSSHAWLALQGLCLFCGNYILFYYAGMHVVSGLLAVCFSTVSLMNVVNAAVFLRQPIDRNAVLAAMVGLAGLGLVFYPELAKSDLGTNPLLGLGLSLLATFLASLGNILSVKLRAIGIPVMEANTIGMSYGALFCLLFALIGGAPFIYDFRPGYSISLVALALFASVIGFGAYLTLVQKIGPGRAGYTAVMFPVVALTLSTFLEHYRWTTLAGIGVALVLSGNLILLLRRRSPEPPPMSQAQKGQIG